jgi:small subunit ribosomal protein S16
VVKIRLFRVGKRNRPYFRVVAVDSRRARESRVLEFLGTYDPERDGVFTLRESAIERWVAQGAQVSDTVRSLMRRQQQAGAAAPPESATS